MVATFETETYGRIEVSRENSRGDSSGCAYFQRQDHEAEVDAAGAFADRDGVPFRVHWPVAGRAADVALEVTVTRTLGFARPQPEPAHV